MHRLASIALILFSVLLLQCKKTEEKKVLPPSAENGTYFSIRQYTRDHFDTYWGQPFSFERVKTVNGERKDSSMVTTLNMDWKEVLEPFFKSDISDAKFLDKYEFSVLDDDISVTKTYYYEAKDEKLFTRKLQINTDPFTQKIKSLYIETKDDDGKQQKLFYSPLRVIQIQEYKPAMIGKGEDTRIEYRFLN